MHQVSIYTLEAKTSHRISEAKCTENKAVKKIKYNGALKKEGVKNYTHQVKATHVSETH